VVAFLFNSFWRKAMHLNLKTVLLPLVIVIVILVGFVSFPDLFHPASSAATPTPAEDELANKAAIDGVTAFFTIDEQSGKQTWIDGLCRVSTESGCAFYRLGLDRLWKQFEAAHTSITPTILTGEKVALPESETGRQVWKFSIELSKVLPGRTEKSDVAYALVVLKNGEWKFDRFLTPDEAQGLVR
jgi:hypothetical protein